MKNEHRKTFILTCFIMLLAIWEMFELLMVVMLVITLVPIAYSFGNYLKHGANKEKD